ncbi:uncharacterized protein LOC131940217 [Physella acuta]|uniref:uncharacterized protein LOC131940217 n=1 Tax=Physella acuta TaxID=109671 RepID=UPI0027DE3F20|nr:uncharacterized protein LOC131940217 [Physella acuta]
MDQEIESSGENDQLTVQKKWKVDKEIADKLSRENEPSRLIPLAKWVVTLILGTVITCLFVSTKLSFIALSSLLSSAKPKSQTFDHVEWTRYNGQFFVIYLAITIPYFLLFVRAVWMAIKPSVSEWPRKCVILCCVVAGTLEPLGIVILALKVLPAYSPVVSACLLCCVVVPSFVIATAESFLDGDLLRWKVLNVLATLLMLKTRPLLLQASSTNISINNSERRRHQIFFLQNTDQLTTWKTSVILYFVKILATFVFSFIFFYIDSEFPINFNEELHSAFLAGWDFDVSIQNDRTWVNFGVNLFGGLICYVLVLIVCHTNTQRGCLGVPHVLSLPLVVTIVCVDVFCQSFIDLQDFCAGNDERLYIVFPVAFILTLGQSLGLGRHAFRREKIHLQKEKVLFWIPGYNGAILDSWLLLDRRQTIRAGRWSRRDKIKHLKPRVYICTTMYREDESEMKQLLESLAKVNLAQQDGETLFESHIVFDGGVTNGKFSEFSLILISLLEGTLNIQPSTCTKTETPYGVKLSWQLVNPRNKQMLFNIHLKDNTLVKNKKRWSQIMYMSYVLDFLSKQDELNEQTYILTTDADVMFTPQSVEALLDLMSRDKSIGAVCARTHPMGSGPIVWYQIFEYAVGHWFQKAAEHVLGSVLCAPGCFSVYRCRALRDTLPKYCKKVESAFDFLTKDMGEDRWLCTLMVQSGWRIEYCAASENSTNCPDNYEEFFKQRRRWIASTLANLMLMIKEWKYVALFNPKVSAVFLLYQGLLLFSTMIAPSMVILVVAGGLAFAWDMNVITSIVLQLCLSLVFVAVCIFTTQKTQMLVAKGFTFVYAIIMCAVTVGAAEHIVLDLFENPVMKNVVPHNVTLTEFATTKRPNQHISDNVEVSVTTAYLLFLIGIFLLGGLLHPREVYCLLHGVWYLLCLPSAYLILIIYSVCNLTDSSWGTREDKSATGDVSKFELKNFIIRTFYSIFFCLPRKDKQGVDVEVQTTCSSLRQVSVMDDVDGNDTELVTLISGFDGVKDVFGPGEFIPVDQWLPAEFSEKYSTMFIERGYDNTLFIKGLTEKDLRKMGLQNRGHIQYLMSQISAIPAFEIEYKVPVNVRDWLYEIGLGMYQENFERCHIRTLKEMEILKGFDARAVDRELGIRKEGHVKRLLYAIRMLRDPTETQQRANATRQIMEKTKLHKLQEVNNEEFEFWEKLRKTCLEPDLKAFGIDSEIAINLVSLRNDWLISMAVSNSLWIILISTVSTKDNLSVLGSNPLDLVFLLIFGLVFLIQFLCMLVHRANTLCHNIARAPYTCGKPLETSWSFKDKFETKEEEDLYQSIREINSEVTRSRRLADSTYGATHSSYIRVQDDDEA